MEVREIVGLGTALIVLAGLSMAIINGQRTAAVADAFTKGFANLISTATFQGSNFQQGSPMG
jgi:hypothetical protein